MALRCVALLAAVALAGGLGACGSDDDLSSDIPRTSPDLTIPTQTTPVSADETTTTSTTSTTSTTTLPDSTTPPPVAEPAAPPAQPVAPPAAPTGGANAGSTGQSTTGGASPGDPDFQNFCRENPGAGPPC